MIKVITIVGTRPELIKLSRVMSLFDEHVNHIIIHTGQNFDYELNEIFYDDLCIRKPDYFLNAARETSSKTIASVIEKVEDVLLTEKPDAIMIYGDTNSCLSVIAAKKLKIPIFHMEAGNRCFDQIVPEELNRKVVDHLSDINFVLTEHSRRNLIAEGIKPETIIKTGSHMYEVLNAHQDKINSSKILNIVNLKPKKYFIVSAHREENVDTKDNLIKLLDTLNALCDEYSIPIIVSTHPRTKKRLEDLGSKKIHSNIKFLKPFGFVDYIKLQMEAFCVISDSGTITEEASLLNLTAITIRETHERPEGMDVGTLIMSGINKNRVIDAVRIVTSKNFRKLSSERILDYTTNKYVSKHILKVVMSYIDYINKNVWHKH
jgi:UDP-N-acetylglucosamine 2-epimerase (non-hydrolysing)